MNQQERLIETHQLAKIYGGDGEGAEVRALDGVDVKIASGEFVTVMGPSGSGKSTLLNMIGALDLPTEGEVWVGGENLAELSNVDQFRARTVGFIFQLHNLLPTLTARENVEVPMVSHLAGSERTRRATELLKLVDLSDRVDHLPNQLSGGERQRVAVARALANNPPLVLADEPTGSLDTSAGHDLMNLLRDLNQSQGTTFLVVTHDPEVARQTDRILLMADGKIVREDYVGTPLEEDLKEWRHTALGESLVAGDGDLPASLKLSKAQVDALRKLLQGVEESD